MNGTVYVLKLDAPLGNGRHKAIFYIGWTRHFEKRMAHHRNGTGAKFTAAAVQRGIGFSVVFTMPGTPADEKRLKRQKGIRRWLRRQGVAV